MSKNVRPNKSTGGVRMKEVPSRKRDEEIFDYPSRIQENTRGPLFASDELLNELRDMWNRSATETDCKVFLEEKIRENSLPAMNDSTEVDKPMLVLELSVE